MRPINQTLLTLIVGLCMASAFLGVYAVGYQYEISEETESSIVWESDTNLLFSELDSTAYIPDMVNVQPYGIGSYMRENPDNTIWHKNNCTPIYTGNLTWEASMVGFPLASPIYYSALHFIPIHIPEAKSFIVDTISINTTLPGESILFQIAIGGYNNPQEATPPSIPGVYLHTANTIASSYSETFELTSYQKLQWYNVANQVDEPILFMYMYDPPAIRDGLSSFALAFNITMTGRPITTWSLQDSMSVVIGGSIALNVAVVLYMNDTIDFGGYRKDLRGSRSGKGKRR